VPRRRRRRRVGADGIVVTQKDAVKIRGPLPVAALRIRIRFLSGEAELREALRAALDRGRRRAKP
jgi:tetraacyldisaccharide-1-P 4'-kinase